MFKEFFSNFSKGEVSELIGARPDLQGYYPGASVLENFSVYPEGAIFRTVGTLFLRSTKADSAARIVPFVFNADQVFLFEMGDGYTRILDGDGILLQEIVTPWAAGDLIDIYYTQSADIMFIAHPDFEIRQINRLSDTNWTVSKFGANPPPTFEADTDVALGGISLTMGATTGFTSITFSAGALLAGDAGRVIKFGASRATITGVAGGGASGNVYVTADFPDTNPILPGSWFLLGSPQAALDPDVKGPAGAAVSLEADLPSFRAADVGKFIRIYDGLIKINAVTDDQHITGIVLSPLTGWNSTTTPDDPDDAAKGSWTMEEASWSDIYGWPRTIEFHQGRFVAAGTRQQPTTFWLSSIDDYKNFGKKPEADAALEYTIRARKVNIIQWLVSLGGLFIGDAQNEHSAKGPGADAPLGGDVIPFVSDPSSVGSLPVQPIVVSNAIHFANRFKNKLLELSYSLDDDAFTPKDLTLLTRQIGDMKFSQLPGAYAQEPFGIEYRVLENGQLACLTRHRAEDVTAWSRIVTQGVFEDVAVLPVIRGHRIYVIVRRTINFIQHRYIEVFDVPGTPLGSVTEFRTWQDIHTHAAAIGTIAPGASVITGLDHLSGNVVDVVLGESYIGQFTVTGGFVQLPNATDPLGTPMVYEVGLHYTSTLRTRRPSIPQVNTEGHKRKWIQVFVRLKDTIGGTLNGQPLRPLTNERPYTGGVFANPRGFGQDYDGYLTLEQTQPYPITILNIAGKIEFAEDMG